MYYYFNTKDKEQLKNYKELIRGIDPNAKSIKQIEELEKAENAPPKKTAPAKGKK